VIHDYSQNGSRSKPLYMLLDWIQLDLNSANARCRSNVLLLMWRTWIAEFYLAGRPTLVAMMNGELDCTDQAASDADLLERYELAGGILKQVNAHLARKGLLLRPGSLVEATIIAHPARRRALRVSVIPRCTRPEGQPVALRHEGTGPRSAKCCS
jgi:hypothetical protein